MSNERRDPTVQLTKKIAPQINTREGFKQAAQELLEKVKTGLQEIDEHISMGLLDPSAVEGNVKDLKFVQKILKENFARSIISLPDTRPQNPGYDDENRDQVMEQVIHYKQLNQRIKEYERLYENGVKKLNLIKENPELAAKTMYGNLASSFGPDLKTPTFPENYMRVAALKSELEKLATMQEEFKGVNRKINEEIRKIPNKSPSDRIKAYQDATETLTMWKEAFKKTHQNIEKLTNKLHSIESGYENAVKRNNTLTAASKELLESSRLKLALNYVEPGDTSFEAIRRDLSALTELPLADSNQPTRFREMQEATKKYNSQADKVTLSYTVLNEKIEAIEAKIKEQVRKTELDIKSQQESFNHLTTDIKKLVSDALLPESNQITEIEKKFNEVMAQTNEKNIAPLVFAQKKLETLKELSEQLKAQVLIEQGLIRDEYKKRINIIDTEIKKKSDATFGKIQQGNFSFSPDDERLVREVKDHLTSVGGNVEGTIHGLREILDEATKRKLEFDKSVGALETILKTHKTAQELADRIAKDDIEAPEFIKAINESPHGSNLLKAMSQYPNGKFNETLLMRILNNHFSEFNQLGIAAIKGFVAHSPVRSADKLDLLKNLAFKEILEAKGIDANPFLEEKNISARKATLYLEKQSQTDFISEDNLHNEAFCTAVAMLEEQKIALTKDMVSALANDPNKCVVVKQQIEQYQQHLEEYEGLKREYRGTEISIPTSRRPITETIFKALIVDFLKVEPEVAKAVNDIIEGKKANDMDQGTVRVCPPWLMVAVKEDQRLLAILSNEKNLEANMRFLGPIFDQSDVKNIYLENYLSDEPSTRLNSQYPFIAPKESSQGKLLTQLAQANNNEFGSAFSLQKMAKVMQKINEFITEQEKVTYDADELKSLKDFRNEVIPVLLSNQKPNEKQDAIENLAANRFKQTGFWARLAECIVEAFQSIMPPNKVLSSAQQAFFSPKRIAAMETMQKMKQDLAEAKAEDEPEDDLGTQIQVKH